MLASAEGKVSHVQSDCISVDCGNKYGGLWLFPFFALELVKHKEPIRTISIDGKDIEISEESFQSLREQLK